jgi:hypothetical protein
MWSWFSPTVVIIILATSIIYNVLERYFSRIASGLDKVAGELKDIRTITQAISSQPAFVLDTYTVEKTLSEIQRDLASLREIIVRKRIDELVASGILNHDLEQPDQPEHGLT